MLRMQKVTWGQPSGSSQIVIVFIHYTKIKLIRRSVFLHVDTFILSLIEDICLLFWYFGITNLPQLEVKCERLPSTENRGRNCTLFFQGQIL